MDKIRASRSQQLMLAGAVGLLRFWSPSPWINTPTGGSSSHTFYNILWHVARGQRCGRSQPGSNPERRGWGWRREGPGTPPLASAAQGTDEGRLEDYLPEVPDSPRNGKQEKILDVLAWLTAMSSHDTNKAQWTVLYYSYYSNVSRRKRCMVNLRLRSRERLGQIDPEDTISTTRVAQVSGKDQDLQFHLRMRR